VTRVTSPGTKTVLDGKEHLRPGDGLPLDGVHPMWSVETVRPDGVQHRIGAMDFLPDGSLVYSEFVPVNNGILRERTNGTLYRLDGVDGGRGRAKSMPVKIAEGFHDPERDRLRRDRHLGLAQAWARSAARRGRRRGLRDARRVPGVGGEQLPPLLVRPAAPRRRVGTWIYGTLSTSIYFHTTYEADPVSSEVIGMNGPNPPHRGSCYRFNIETHEVQWLGGGLRTPNGVHVDSQGRVLVADNQGAWHPANRLNHIKYDIDDEGTVDGRFFGHYNGLQRSKLFPEAGRRRGLHGGGRVPPRGLAARRTRW
jgi:hypothetical protein